MKNINNFFIVAGIAGAVVCSNVMLYNMRQKQDAWQEAISLAQVQHPSKQQRIEMARRIDSKYDGRIETSVYGALGFLALGLVGAGTNILNGYKRKEEFY